MTPIDELLTAAEAGDAARVRALLVAAPELVDATGPYGKTALHLAAEKDHVEVARVLLAHGARLDLETTWEMTPLEWAANLGSQRVADLLLAEGAVLDLWSAAGLGRLADVQAFWDAAGRLSPAAFKRRYRREPDGSWAADTEDQDESELVAQSFAIACRNGHTAVARLLREHGAELDVRAFWGGTPLHWAAANGHLETVRYLLASGARTDLRDEKHHDTAEGWARHLGHHAVADLIAAHLPAA